MVLEFYAFIKKEKANERGVSLDDIGSPYDIWNNLALNDISFIIDVNGAEKNILYRRLCKDPEYIKKYVSCGN